VEEIHGHSFTANRDLGTRGALTQDRDGMFQYAEQPQKLLAKQGMLINSLLVLATSAAH
jgi:hypothetical protein